YKTMYYSNTIAKNNNNDGIVLLFATDIVLLGSLNDCDTNGAPQFFKSITSTTYNMPTDILFTDTTISFEIDDSIKYDDKNNVVYQQFTEATGCDWGNLNRQDECGKMGKDHDGGLFYGIGCSTIELEAKSCLNLRRICEYGVSLDERKYIPNLNNLNDESETNELTPDGFISYDELYDIDGRSMFATLNGNRLRTKVNEKTGLKEYDFRYLYTDNFDGLSQTLMKNTSKAGNCNYKYNYNLETMSDDYYLFRMGVTPLFYDTSNTLPRYESSFYFYFGL
ncbi:MAG: hypothetical protein K2H20_00790, partial [Bacilli bacterium]|nr:hypothetical protein [Bacilli bacterium]